MAYWKQLEPTETHLTYLLLSLFLVLYALSSLFIRNRLHLSEPPFATLFGIIFGPKALGVVDPTTWRLGDIFTQEFSRVIVAIQCFAVGVDLPKYYFTRHGKSVLMLLLPVMTFGWIVCGLIVYWIFDTSIPTALVVSACLTPTDPVLAASILSESHFSIRVPARIRHLLSAESACNDGVSFPFLYIGISVLTRATPGGAIKKWFLITILWQCIFGTALGWIIGRIANRTLRYSYRKKIIGAESYVVFYLLLALFCVGVASTLGVDDFLLAFAAGLAFGRDGWFSSQTAGSQIPSIIDMKLNSSMFVYFGAKMPWDQFSNMSIGLTPPRLVGLLLLVLLVRRIPMVLALKPLIHDVRRWREAFFVGHFGPIGIGALFLAIEARAQLETDTSIPTPFPPEDLPWRNQRAVDIIWPIICFLVLGSTLVHGISPLIISVVGHFSLPKDERAPLIGGETDRLHGMDHDVGGGESADEEDDTEAQPRSDPNLNYGAILD